ncbi:Polynucleotide 5'-hydroxyl-kinase grc3, partial [Marasmius crinis-equi]
MISAIAARKAAQAKLPPNLQPQPEVDSNESKSSSPAPAKRKRPSEISNPHPKNKKKKLNNKPPSTIKKTRYFQEPDPIARQDDIILIESDDDEEDEEEPDVLEPAATGRAWSPSGPVNSDDEEAEGSTPNGPRTISTYCPVPHQNLFTLEQEEIAALGLPSCSGCKAVLIPLADEDTIALLGTYTITVIHGSVSLLGARLETSQPQQHHRVFAPRSSPIPVLKASSSGKPIAAKGLE